MFYYRIMQSNFSNIDLLRCFFLVGEKGNLSRRSLHFSLEMDEKTIKHMLELLKKKEIIASSRKGHALTKKGKYIFEILKEYISLPKTVNTPFYPGKQQVAIQLKTNKDIPIDNTHRNIAIKAGADAAFLMKFKNSISSECIGLDDFDTMETLFDFRINNILVVTFADTLRDAVNAALAVALTLDNGLNKELGQLENYLSQ